MKQSAKLRESFEQIKRTAKWATMKPEEQQALEKNTQDRIRSFEAEEAATPEPSDVAPVADQSIASQPEADRPTKALYDSFQKIKQTPRWQSLDQEKKDEITNSTLARYRQLQEMEGTAETPDVKQIESQEIWKPYQPQEESQFSDAASWDAAPTTPPKQAPITLGSVGRALGKSIARAPGSFASTLVGAGGVAADIVGKGMQYLPVVDGIGETISQVGKDTINVANTLDAWNQHLLPTEQAMPRNLQEFGDMTAGQKALLAADQIPEQLGTMLLPGMAGAKFAQAAAAGAKGAKAAGVLKPLTGYLASKGPKAAQALGALTGSTIQSAAEIGKSQMQEAGDTNALATLIAAPIAGKLESLVPASAEWLSGAFKGASRKAFSEAMKSPLKFLGHFTKEVAKNGATESATELAQEAITKFATESAKGEKGLSMLDAASRAKNILNKEGLDGLIKAAKNDPTVGQLAMAAIMGGVAGGIFEGAGISVGGAKYLASPVRVYDNMVNAKTTEEKQKAADRLAKLSPLARQKAREEAAYRSIFELDDAETDEESVQEAFNVFREVGKNERDGYYANLAKTGWAPSAIHQERLQKFFEENTARQSEDNQQPPESNQTPPTVDQTAQSQPRPDQSGTTQNRVVDLINEINVEGSDEHQAYLRALEDAAEPDETTRRAKSNFGIDGDMDQANYSADELTRLFPPEDLISKPAKDISGTEIPGAGWAGKNTNIRAGDKSYAGHYAVVELDSLSTNKNMGTLQNRDRTRAASTAQVESIANNPDPDKLISADVFANDGPMVVGPDMVVESGNGRTMGLRSAYDKGTAEGYRQAVAKRAAEFGIPAENVLNMKKPALVRVRSENLDDQGRSEFVSQANAPRQLQRSPSEKAMTDGQAILPFLHQLETQNLASKSNGQFFTDFFQKVATPEEAGALTLPNGNVSQEGLNRVRNAIFAAAYGDPEILVSLTEDPDSRIKSILNGLQESVVDTARLTAESKTGAVHPVSINDILPGAAKKVADIRASGTDLEEYFLQGQFGKDGMQPAERILLGFFATQKSAQKIGALVKTFNDIVRSYGPPAQMAFPGMEQEAPTAESVLRQAISKEFPELNEAVDRWAQGPAALNPTFSKKRADSQKNQKLIQLLEQFGETADPQTAKTAQSLVDLINQIGGNQDVEFSKKSPKQSATISREELDQTAASIQSNLDRQHGIKVIVVESTKELSEKLKQDVPQSVEGALVGRNVYLVRENLPDTRRAIEVAGHEVIGHFGLKSLLKGEWGALVDDFALLGEKDQGVLSEIERAKRDYGNDKGMTRDRIIDEALARTAEKFAADPDSFSERAKAWFNDTLSRIQDSLRAIGFDIEFNARDLSRTIRGAKTEVTATGAFNSRSLNKIEELISQIESEDPKTKDAKFSYAGMRADNGRVVEASRRLQNGEDPERIRKETGWFKGPYDGAMRLEIDDSKMSVNFDALADSEFSPENLKTTLGDVLNHPDLYAIYPELKDLPLLNAELDGAKGRYQPALKGREGLGALFVNKSKLDPESLKATLVHELQHVIQEIEGFAKGGSMDEFLRKYKKELRELEDQVGEINREMDFAYKSGNKDYYYELMNQRHGLVEKINSLSGPEDMGPYDRANNDYLNLAGEVEARDAAGRQRKSLAGRKKYAPFTDPQTGELKTPKEDAIVRFSYAGQRANRPQNIGSWKEAKARLDEGEDAETVRLETGWFVSPYDKMPRFELDDSKAKWLSKPKYNKDGRANIGYLGEMLKHDELFSAYPKLKDALVKINLEPELNISGAAHAPTMTTPAYIEVNAPDQDTAKEVLVHEFQHLIQHYEGFARGGSSSGFEQESEDEARKRAARSYSDIARSIFENASQEFQSAARRVNRAHNLNFSADEQSEEYYQARKEFSDKFGKDAEEYLMNSDFADQAWRGEINYDARGKHISPLSPYDKYRSLAGEVEARDAAERTGLSSKERKLYPPFSTAEIEPEDAIVRFSKKNSENKLESLLNQIGPDAQPDKMSDLERILNEIPTAGRQQNAEPVEAIDSRFSKKLQDVNLQAGDAKPLRLNISGDNFAIKQNAATEMNTWPKKITAADGLTVLLRNPEAKTMVERMLHLITDKKKNITPEKAAWLPNVPQTLKFADLKLFDARYGNHAYVRKYADGTEHIVIVRKDGTIEDQSVRDQRLITQFPKQGKGEQDKMEVVWMSEGLAQRAEAPSGSTATNPSNGTKRFPENLGPTNPGSTTPGSDQETFQDNYNPTDDKVKFSKAYHGTPHRGIEKEGFRLNRIGTGEGNQAYGWGMYFAGDKEVAEHYRKKLSYREQVKQFRQELPDNASIDEVLEAAQNGDLPEATANVITALAADDWLGFDYPSQAITAAFKELDNYDASPALHEAVKKYSGQLYHAEIPDDTNLLDWDSPLENQPEHVRKSLEAEIDKFRNSEGAEGAYVSESATGEQIYKEMVFAYGSPRAASERLNALGVPGLRYFDGNSRKEGSGSHNYVIWNESSMNEDVTPYYSKQNGSGGQPDPFDPDPEPMPTLTETTKSQAEKVADALKKVAGGLMGDTRSQADRKRPDFKRAQTINPEADTDFELEHNTKNAAAVKSRKAEDALIISHLDADKNIITGLIRKMTQPGDLQDWMLKKAARVLAPFQAAKPIERILFTVAENMAYDEKSDTLKASPGVRQYNADSGEYEYIPSPHAAAAEHFYNTLAPEWKQLMIDRAKENEAYRKNFVDVVIPHAKAQTAIALLARYRQLGADKSALQGAESEARSMLQKVNGKIDQAEYKELESMLESIVKMPADRIAKNTVALERIIKTAKGELKTPAALQAELKRLNSNKGHYGYVHHYFESEKTPSQGKPFDAFGRIPNGWIEETPGTQKQRTGAEGNTQNLLKADIAKNNKEIKAEASNTWMQQAEDQRGLLVEDWQDIPDDQMPEGYSERKRVIANFGKFRGKEIYLPDGVYDFYKQVREVGLEDPGMKEFGDVVQLIDGATNRMNEAMLYHTGKFARDLMAAPFHMIEFLRDWSTKNPRESVLAFKALMKATAKAATPSTWQKYTPESEGEYSESLAYQNKEGETSFLTKAGDSIGAWFTDSIPVGSTIASFLKELNLSGSGDLPMKRIMRSVGEQIADAKGLAGKERERFVYDMVNDYAFVTQDLPAALAYLRGQRPTKGSRAWGAVMRTTIPFLGYSSRLAKQMLADPISKGAIPMAKRLVGKQDKDADFLRELSETSRPFVWLFIKSLVAAGLGGLIPKEEEGLASEIQDAKNLDPLARTHGRILIGQDNNPEGGERWLSNKGLSHLQVADAVSKAVDGKSSIKDFSAEFLTIHPTMQTLLGMAGVENPYQANVPMTAQLGRSLAQVMVPQMTRLGPDLAKFFRAVSGNNTIPDAKKQTFFSAFFEQLGVPAGAVKVDRDGKLRTTKPGLEALKLIGLNIREIPYDMIAEAAESEAKSLDHLVKRIETIQEYRDGDRDQDLTEREFIAKTLKTNRFTNLDEALRDAEDELRKRGRGILATVAKLREKGRPIETERPGKKDPFEPKMPDPSRRFLRKLPGQKGGTLETLIRDIGNDTSKTADDAISDLERILQELK